MKGKPVWKILGSKALAYCDHGTYEDSEARPPFEEVVQLMVSANYIFDPSSTNHLVVAKKGQSFLGRSGLMHRKQSMAMGCVRLSHEGVRAPVEAKHALVFPQDC